MMFAPPPQTTEHLKRITFDAASHRYLLDGSTPLKSVTTVIGDFYNGPKAPPDRLAAAANRGTIGHALIDADERGDERAVGQEPGWVMAARAWRKNRLFRTLHIEQRLFHEEWGVAGTCDRICVFSRPNPAPEWWPEQWGAEIVGLADWKTGKNIPSMCAAQLAAYRAMLAEWGIVWRYCPIVAVNINREGQWRDKWYLGSEPDALWAGALMVHRLRPSGFEGERW